MGPAYRFFHGFSRSRLNEASGFSAHVKVGNFIIIINVLIKDYFARFISKLYTLVIYLATDSDG